MNPVEISDAVTELAQLPFDGAEFPFQFLAAFGNKKTTIDRLRAGNTNQSDIPGGVLQRSNIHIATAAPGEVADTLTKLRNSPKNASQKARFILATDGHELQAEDVTTGETIACDYADFANHFGFLLPLAGITTVAQIRESSFDIRATGRLNKLYVTLLQDNPDWASADRRADMNHFMARLIFCFFAEDTDIFHAGYKFTETVERMSGGGADNTHEVIAELFRAMNTPLKERETAGIKTWANGFPYVNGQLFSGNIDALASELSAVESEEDITQLRHVRSAEEKRAAEEIARRDKCHDFENFKPLFEQVKQELASGARVTRPFELKAEIRPGAFFIVGGLITYVAEMEDIFTNAQGRTDARLRVIFDNGTESGMLMRSLQRQLHDDDAGRRITDPAPGPLFADKPEDGEAEAGTIYVLRSKSDHPFVAEHRDVVHKIGVTSGSVDARISGAEKSSTYLLAGVEVVATYKVYGVNCQKLESLLHKVFAEAQLDLSIPDRFGHMVKPREWFAIPLQVINEAVDRIRDRSITSYRYSPSDGRLERIVD